MHRPKVHNRISKIINKPTSVYGQVRCVRVSRNSPNMRNPDMLLTAEAGLLADITGGEDAMEEIRRAVEAARDESQ